MRKNTLNKRGFTLAELLIVVAIIAVLAVIAIPIFSAKLESSREETDIANLRAAKAAAVTEYLNTGEAGEYVFDAVGGKLVDMDEIDTIEAYGQGTATDGGCEDYYMYTDDSGNDVYYNTETDAKSAGYIKVSWTTDGVVSLSWIDKDGNSESGSASGGDVIGDTSLKSITLSKFVLTFSGDASDGVDHTYENMVVTDLDSDGKITVLDAIHQASILYGDNTFVINPDCDGCGYFGVTSAFNHKCGENEYGIPRWLAIEPYMYDNGNGSDENYYVAISNGDTISINIYEWESGDQ